MPKYSVTVERTVTHSTTLDIEAATEDAASDKAAELAESDKDQAGAPIDWTFDDENFEVIETDAEEEEDEEDEEEEDEESESES